MTFIQGIIVVALLMMFIIAMTWINAWKEINIGRTLAERITDEQINKALNKLNKNEDK